MSDRPLIQQPRTGLRLLCLTLLLHILLSGNSLASQGLQLADLHQQGVLAQAAAEFIEAFNASDPDLLQAFMAGYRDAESLARTPVAARVQRQIQFHGMLGQLSLQAVGRHEESFLEITVQSAKTGGFFQFTFEAGSLDPLKISSMGLRPTSPPQAVSDDEADAMIQAASLEQLVEAALVKHRLPALAVAVAQDSTLFAVVRGVRNQETKARAQTDDLFHIGSITKSMTAAIAARLVDQGRLNWSDKLGERCPSLWMNSQLNNATLTQLLHHRAGVNPLLDLNAEDEAAWRSAADSPAGQRAAMLTEILQEKPTAEPGTSFSYSNAGYIAAAAMMEGADGRTWEALVAQEVFKPLGLHSAGLGWPATNDRPDQPRGHWAESDGRRVQELEGYELGGLLAPAGDVHLSIADLARYGQAHLQALAGDSSWLRLESAQTLHTLPDTGSTAGYAMGWMVEEIDGKVCHQHAGSAGTFYAFLCLVPETGQVVAVAMNDGSLANDAVAREILQQVWRLTAQTR